MMPQGLSMKKAKSKAWADFIWNKERGYINLHTRAYLLCPTTRQGNQLPREYVNRQSQCTLDHVSSNAPVKSCTVETEKISWPSSHFDDLRSRWSRKLLMRRSWDWKFSPTPKREVKSTDLTKTKLPYDEERTWSHEKRCVGKTS